MIALLKLTPYGGDAVVPSPNHDAREAPEIQGIVLHATADEGNEALALSWLRSPKSRVSCHLLVGRAGRVIRLVGDRQRAWHAGIAWWRGTSDVNSITLGIEIANRNDGEPYTDAQYGRVAEIVAHYCRQGLSLDDVVSHGEIAAGGRRTDPLGWDWERFRTMVQHQLRAATDVQDRLIYDRRSAERRAAEEAAAYGSTDVPSASVSTHDTPPSVSAEVRRPSIPPARAPERGGGAAPTAPTAERQVTAPPKPRPSATTPPPKPRPSVAATPQKPRPSAITPPQTQRAPAGATPKPVLRSRTLWLNGLTVLAAGSVIVGETLDLAFSVGLTVPEEITMWVLFGVGVVNIILRFQTTCPIGRSPYLLEPAEQERLDVLGKLPRR